MTTNWQFAWRNIWRNKRRTILTMCAIGFGASLIVFSVGLQLGQYDLMISGSTRIYQGLVQVQKKGYLDEARMRNSIADAQTLANNIRKTTAINDVAVRANGFALVSSRERTYGVAVIGVETRHEGNVSIIPGLVKEGRYLANDNASEVVIGRSLAKNLKITLGDELTILGSGRDGSIAATIFPVVGIFDSGSRELDRGLVQIPLNSFQQVFSMGNHAHAVVIYHQNAELVDTLKTQLQPLLKAADPDLLALGWDQIQPGIKESIELDYSSGWFMYIVLVAIITFSIMNTFLMSVLERTREFGIMLALGFKPINIGKLVMMEALILTLFALIAGTLIGLAVNYYFLINGLTFEGMEEIAAQYNMPATITPQISIESTLLGPAVILIFTLLAALYPAMKIRKLEPVEAMRHI
ncbi:MAG: FtsX-like permease family protein [Gammaproteobacteria bacterium]|nr:FtsX-like permease family protein [Gammaproteobacteria bacterium]